jgi:anthranilate synthase component 1
MTRNGRSMTSSDGFGNHCPCLHCVSTEARPAVTGTSPYAREKFLADVERIREYIIAGDCFQALLSRRIQVPHDFPSESLYRALRALNPSPYMYHLVLDGMELVGKLAGAARPRGGQTGHRASHSRYAPARRDATDDERLSGRAARRREGAREHVMLVDLGRNDVGRVARYGTVAVTELMRIERYSHVLHIVSQVEGDLRDDVSGIDVFRATFPAGNDDGRAEGPRNGDHRRARARATRAVRGGRGIHRRGRPTHDLAITIRTCVIADGVASVQDRRRHCRRFRSEREWEETENKARALLTAIGQIR